VGLVKEFSGVTLISIARIFMIFTIFYKLFWVGDFGAKILTCYFFKFWENKASFNY